MKTTALKPLTLNLENLKKLTDTQAEAVAGAVQISGGIDCGPFETFRNCVG